jgi:hypothetical protein
MDPRALIIQAGQSTMAAMGYLITIDAALLVAIPAIMGKLSASKPFLRWVMILLLLSLFTAIFEIGRALLVITSITYDKPVYTNEMNFLISLSLKTIPFVLLGLALLLFARSFWEQLSK